MLNAALLAVCAQTGDPLPPRLDAASFAKVREYATPTDRDLGYQAVDWKTSVFDAVNAARKEDRPILMWMYFGDPRGKC